MAHAPSAARTIRQRIRRGDDPTQVHGDIRGLGDPAHAAPLWALAAGDPRLALDERRDVLRRAAACAAAVERYAQKGETWRDVLRQAGAAAVNELIQAAVTDIESMPAGAWVDAARAEIAPFLSADGGSTPERDDPWSAPAGQPRWEALRVMAWNAEPDQLSGLAAAADGRDSEDAARFLCALAAKADRSKQDPSPFIEQAQTACDQIADERRRAKVQAKIDQTRGGPPAKPTAAPTEAPRIQLPRSTGRTFALVNGYHGGLDLPHLRAAARGAALCVAFGHDLALVDFPTASVEEFVAAAAGQTNIGEDTGPLAALAKGRRLRLDLPDGPMVATTPHPAEDRAIDRLPDGPLTLLVGLGKNGLPRLALNQAQHHYELTGRGVSLETATAMGILADRLAGDPMR